MKTGPTGLVVTALVNKGEHATLWITIVLIALESTCSPITTFLLYCCIYFVMWYVYEYRHGTDVIQKPYTDCLYHCDAKYFVILGLLCGSLLNVYLQYGML